MKAGARPFVFAASSFIAGFILCYLMLSAAQPKPRSALVVASSARSPAVQTEPLLTSISEQARSIIAPFAPPFRSEFISITPPNPPMPPASFRIDAEPEHPPHDDSLGKYSTDLIDFRSKPDFTVEPAQ